MNAPQPKPEVAQGRRWRYQGPGPVASRGVAHTITGVTKDEGDGPQVTTWSDSYGKAGDPSSGDAWMGPLHTFLAHFAPIRTL